MKKSLSPDEIVERALKRLPKVPLEVLDEEFQPRMVLKSLHGYPHHLRVEMHKRWIFWRFEIQDHLLDRDGLVPNPYADWRNYVWSRFFLSEKACIRAAHKRLDKLGEPEPPKRLLGQDGGG